MVSQSHLLVFYPVPLLNIPSSFSFSFFSSFFFLPLIDFSVATPPALSIEEYTTFLHGFPVHPSLFYFAVKEGKIGEAVEILRANPTLNLVNWKNGSDNYQTAFHLACAGTDTTLVFLLLAHPDIDINPEDGYGGTPFHYASNPKLFRVLIKDPQVQVSEMGADGYTALDWAAHNGRLEVVKWWIASNREISSQGPIEMAEAAGKTEVAHLLKTFEEDPIRVREDLRVELGWHDELAAEVFALVIFVSDGLLATRPTHQPSFAATFFEIARRLPIELQMLLAGLTKENITTRDREETFKALALKYFFS